MTTTLPKWLFPDLVPGVEIEAFVEPATPYRARASIDDGSFDWLPRVTSDYFPVDDAGTLSLWSRYEEPFKLLRRPPAEALWRLLGLYQAEGSKSETASDWSMANSNPLLVKAAVDALTALGVTRERQYIEVLHGRDQIPAQAEKIFEHVGVRRAVTRLRTGEGGHAAVLHPVSSSALLRLFRGALAEIFSRGFPSPEAARAYALGWLDGDGGLVINPTSIELRLAGHTDEHHVVKQALTTAFSWVFEDGAYHRDTKQGTHITLRAHEMLDLLDAGAFPFSMNRVRLLLAFDERTRKLRNDVLVGPFVRWGLRNKDGNLTELGERVCNGHEHHTVEIEKARRFTTGAPFKGQKGLPNPLIE